MPSPSGEISLVQTQFHLTRGDGAENVSKNNLSPHLLDLQDTLRA